eukprot:gene31304-38676_t
MSTLDPTTHYLRPLLQFNSPPSPPPLSEVDLLKQMREAYEMSLDSSSSESDTPTSTTTSNTSTTTALLWREDKSNQSRDYKRNEVRLDLVPMLSRLT